MRLISEVLRLHFVISQLVRLDKNVTQIPTQLLSSLSTAQTRPQGHTLIPKSSLKSQQPKMEHTKLKQMQNDQRLQGSNAQRLSQSVQGSLSNSTQRQQTTNVAQQRDNSRHLRRNHHFKNNPLRHKNVNTKIRPFLQNLQNHPNRLQTKLK